jgi:hypothetical protein
MTKGAADPELESEVGVDATESVGIDTLESADEGELESVGEADAEGSSAGVDTATDVEILNIVELEIKGGMLGSTACGGSEGTDIEEESDTDIIDEDDIDEDDIESGSGPDRFENDIPLACRLTGIKYLL